MKDTVQTHTDTHEGARVIVGRNGGKLRPFTPETSRLAAQARAEKRMRLYAEGAGLAVVDHALVKQYGEDAHIVERARTLQEIATTPDAGKAAVMADASLRKAQGLEDKTPITTGGNVTNVLVLDAEAAEAIRRALGDVVDAE